MFRDIKNPIGGGMGISLFDNNENDAVIQQPGRANKQPGAGPSRFAVNQQI